MLNPINQSMPIVLPIDEQQKEIIQRSKSNKIKLMYGCNLIAVLTDPEIFAHRKEERIHRQFGHSDPAHPGIQLILQSGDWLLGGDLHVSKRDGKLVLKYYILIGFQSNNLSRRP
jgi:ATP sulfurylase